MKEKLNTKREDLLSKKALLREEIAKKIVALSLERKEEASKKLLLLPRKNYLSFTSLRDEVDTRLFNELLAREERLFLPKVVGPDLWIYRVTDFHTMQCERVTGAEIEAVLVPGRAFDSANRRLGRGKGYYDRFLCTLNCETIGLGYEEQLVDEVPVESHDVTLNALYLL